MSIILELRKRASHAGTPLVHPHSESVVLGNVFGIVKNLSFDAALNPWLVGVTKEDDITSDEWGFSFWERQRGEPGISEGSTEVDLVLTSPDTLVFIEVKLDAAPSQGPAHDPDRNQLVRNLDVGRRRAKQEGKKFVLMYITPDRDEPAIVGRIRASESGPSIASLHWSPWGKIGEALAVSYRSDDLHAVEQAFALDLLAYLAAKGLWQSSLADDPIYYGDKLYRSLRATNSPFVPYGERARESDESWRSNEWDEAGIRDFLDGLRPKEKFLLRMIAQANGSELQGRIMASVPFLSGRTSASLSALKSQINAGCKGRGKAPILAVGAGKRADRVHEINPGLGKLRQVVIDVALAFVIPAHLVER